LFFNTKNTLFLLSKVQTKVHNALMHVKKSRKTTRNPRTARENNIFFFEKECFDPIKKEN